eukprot:g6444.t1
MGAVQVREVGTVVLRFSNEFSFWTPKYLECKAQVEQLHHSTPRKFKDGEKGFEKKPLENDREIDRTTKKRIGNKEQGSDNALQPVSEQKGKPKGSLENKMVQDTDSKVTKGGENGDVEDTKESKDDEHDDFDSAKESPKSRCRQTIEAGDMFHFPITVPRPALLTWLFETSGGDIDFSAYFMDVKNNTNQPLVMENRVDSHEYPQMGEVQVRKAGTVVLCFSNEYSFWTAKELTCKTQLEPLRHSTPKKFSTPKPFSGTIENMKEDVLAEVTAEATKNEADMFLDDCVKTTEEKTGAEAAIDEAIALHNCESKEEELEETRHNLVKAAERKDLMEEAKRKEEIRLQEEAKRKEEIRLQEEAKRKE